MLYVCEAWAIILREQRRLRVFENRIQKRMFGLKKVANGKWRMLHNDELHYFYCLPNVVREIKIEMGRSFSENGRR